LRYESRNSRRVLLVREKVAIFFTPSASFSPSTVTSTTTPSSSYAEDGLTPVAAVGGYTHVFVHPDARRPFGLKEERMRKRMEALLRKPDGSRTERERWQSYVEEYCCDHEYGPV
jgi:hypothetical protein